VRLPTPSPDTRGDLLKASHRQPSIAERDLESYARDLPPLCGPFEIGPDGRPLIAVAPHGVRRQNRGLHRALRKELFEELFGFFDPDKLVCDPKPPPQMQAAFADVIGKPPEYKLAWHPGFQRWAAFQRVRDPSQGEGRYQCFSIAMEPAEDDKLPADLAAEGKRYEHLRGVLGDFKLFTRQDFETIVYYGDRWRFSVDELVARHDLQDDLRALAAEKRLADQDFESLDYYYLAINTAANGGSKQYSVPFVALSRDPQSRSDRYVREQRNGYTVIRKRMDERTEAEREQRATDEVMSKHAALVADLSREQERERQRKLLEAGRAVIANRPQKPPRVM